MPFDPGFLFVIATLVPLASFVVLLIWGGIRWTLRPHAEHGGSAAAAFDALGGAVGGRAPAFVATAAIAISCALAVTGFVRFIQDHGEFEAKKFQLELDAHRLEAAQAKLEEQIKDIQKEKGGAKKTPDELKKALRAKRKELREISETLHAKHREIEGAEAAFAEPWSARVPWVGVLPRGAADPGKGTAEDPGSGTLIMIGYRIDMLSALMFVMVTFIATLIHVFSLGYMNDETQAVVEDHQVHAEDGHYRRRGRFGRFFMFLSLFCFSMLNLLLADNLFQIFVSWELVGVCSYLLVGFYFERQSAANAANKAFITNRVGDAGFLIGLMILWTYVGTFNFEDLFHRLRAPAHDSHEAIALHDQFISVNRAAPIDGGHAMAVQWPTKRQNNRDYIFQPGSDVLVFPRNTRDHWHFGEHDEHDGHAENAAKPPQIEVDAYAHPKADQFGYMPYWMLVVAGLGIFLGCVGKSAQFPLQVWLPDAMEGPTPVSALIHAATMVAAGVYLVARVYPLFVPDVLLVIAYIGAITLFVAATVAVVMTDIKKVLAYSTVSQLGYMMLALGVGGWVAGAFHLMTHAFFKALLFLGSGSVIYGCHHEQDMLKMGGLYPKMRITALTMLAGTLAICGIPLFSGWYSKDAIIVSALSFWMDNRHHVLLFALPLITAGLTTFYMFRMWFLTFTGKPRDHHVHEHAHESPLVMTVPLIVLAICSIFVAWGIPPWEAHESKLAHMLEHSQPTAALVADLGSDVVGEAEMMRAGYHETAGALALLMVVFGLIFAGALYAKNYLDPADAKEQFTGVHGFLTRKWYFDEFYSAMFVRPSLTIAGWARAFDTYVIDGIVHLIARIGLWASRVSGMIDRGIVDGLVNVIGDAWYGIGAWLRTFQTGYLRSYVLFIALAAIAIWFALVSLFGVAVGAP